MSQKAATLEHKPKNPSTNGHVYQPKPSATRLLLFDPADEANEEYRGLKIYARTKIPMSVYFQAAAPVEANDPDYWEKVSRRHRDFAQRTLVSWNLVYPEDHDLAGQPIPATADGFMELDLDLAVAIRSAWFYTLRTPEGVVDPLESA